MDIVTRLLRVLISATAITSGAAFATSSAALAIPDSVSEATLSPQRLERVDSAEYYIAARRYPDAERCLKEALRLEPASRQNAMLLSNLGIVQMESGLLDDALQSFDIALNIAPGSSLLLTNRGGLLLRLDRTDDGIADLSRALEIDSTLIRPRTLRAMALLNRQDFDGAERDLRVLLDGSPNDDALLASLARCREIAGCRKEAEALTDSAIRISPQPEYFFSLTRMQILDENWEKASATVNEGIRTFPRAADLYMLRGYLHRKRYLPSEAAADRKTALRLGADPAIVNAWLPEK